MNKLLLSFGMLNAAIANQKLINYGKGPNSVLDVVVDDEGEEFYWIMAPKPGYEVPFDLRKDELLILQAQEGND
jgi:hypothetical protein